MKNCLQSLMFYVTLFNINHYSLHLNQVLFLALHIMITMAVHLNYLYMTAHRPRSISMDFLYFYLRTPPQWS